MTSYGKQFQERKQEVLTMLQNAQQYLTEIGSDSDAKKMQALYDALENEEFTIALIGEFSAGKSTFLNALLGEWLLPSWGDETTATVTRLLHAKHAKNGEQCRVFYNNGDQKVFEKVDRQALTELVAVNQKRDVASSISRVELYLDNRFLEDDVILIDTPGLNGLKEQLADITYTQADQSSACIFLFNGQHPGAATDFELIKLLREKIKSIFYVVNQIDVVESAAVGELETVEDIVEHLHEKYRSEVPDAEELPTIYPVSAKKALAARSPEPIVLREGKVITTPQEKADCEEQSRFAAFEERLWKYLTLGEKGRDKLLSPLKHLTEQLEQVIRTLNQRMDLLDQSADTAQLAADKEKLQQALDKLRQELKKTDETIKTEMKKAERDFSEEIKAEINRFRDDYLKKVENFQDLDDIDPDNIVGVIQRQIQRILERAYASYEQTIRELAEELTEDIAKSDAIAELLAKGMKIQVDRKPDLVSYHAEIEKMEEEVGKVHQEIEKLQALIDSGELEAEAQRKIEREIQKKERNLKEQEGDLRAKQAMMDAQMPAARIRHEQGTELQDRSGFLGKIAQFFVGQKQVQIDRVVIDTTEQEYYKKHMEDQMKPIRDEIDRINGEIALLGTADPVACERKQKQLEHQMREKKERELKIIAEHAEKVRKLQEKQLKKQREQIENYIEDITGELCREIEKQFMKLRKGCIEALQDIAVSPIAEQINRQQKDIDQIEQDLKLMKDEREELKKKLEAQVKELSGMRVKANDLWADLDQIKADVIT